jgi:S-adenosylmethionine synthetase
MNCANGDRRHQPGRGRAAAEQGRRDQGMMFGYATRETANYAGLDTIAPYCYASYQTIHKKKPQR